MSEVGRETGREWKDCWRTIFIFFNTINITNKFFWDLVLYLSCICLGARM